MATVRLRLDKRHIVDCNVADSLCPQRKCFWTTRRTVRGGDGIYVKDDLVCGHRDQTGCPDAPEDERPEKMRLLRGVWRAVVRA